jgi:hypothetical protein
MVRRISLVTSAVFLGLAWILAAQVWASAVVTESGIRIKISGIDSYPQLTFIFFTGLIMLWLSRYMNSVFTQFITSAVLALLLSTTLPILFDAASSSIQILGPQISKLSGVSDWLGQSELLSTPFYNSFASDLTLVSLGLWFVSAVTYLWAPKQGQKRKEFTTRIDNLPSW